MQKLHLVGFTTDHEGLILSARRGSRSGGYLLAVDAAVEEAVEALRARRAEEPEEDDEVIDAPRTPRVESTLPVREIQARLRQGRSIADVAKAAGVDVAWVERFAPPILAERAQMISRVQSAPLRRARLGPSALPIGEAVRHHLADRVVVLSPEEFASAWTARQLANGRWAVRFTFHYRGRNNVLRFDFDESSGEVTAADRQSGQLGYVMPIASAGKARRSPTRSGPARRAVSRPVVSTGFRADPTPAKAVSRSAKERERAAAAMRKAAAQRAAEAERAAARRAKERAAEAARKERQDKAAAAQVAREGRAKAAAERAKAAAAKKRAAEQAKAKAAAVKARVKVKEVAAKKAAVKKAAVKKAAAKKAAAERAASKPAPTKAVPTKAAVTKAAVTKGTATGTVAKKADAKKPATKAAATKAAVSKAAVSKAAVSKAAVSKAVAPTLAPTRSPAARPPAPTLARAASAPAAPAALRPVGSAAPSAPSPATSRVPAIGASPPFTIVPRPAIIDRPSFRQGAVESTGDRRETSVPRPAAVMPARSTNGPDPSPDPLPSPPPRSDRPRRTRPLRAT